MPEGDRNPSAGPEGPLIFAAGAAVFATVFGEFAHDIAKWIACARDGSCSPTAKRDAAEVATLISTFVAVGAATLAARMGDKTRREAGAIIVGALAGALLAILKAAEGTGDVPQLDLLVRPLIVYFLLAAIATVAIVVDECPSGSGQKPLTLLYQISIVLLTGALVGAAYQYIAHLAWTIDHGNRSSGKFVVAPAAPIIATAVFGVLMTHCRRRRSLAVAAWLTLAVIAAAAYFVFGYHPDHVASWLAQEGVSDVRVGVLYVVLLLAGVAMMAAAATKAGRSLGRMLLLSLPFAFVTGWCGWELGEARVLAGEAPPEAPIVLAAVHALVPTLGVFAMFLGLWLGRNGRELPR